MTYTKEFRQRVLAHKEKEGLTYDETSKRFGVGRNTLFEWKRRIEPKATRDKPATKIDMDLLKRDVEDNPDRFQYERAEDYGVSQSAIYYALKRLNITRKKNSVSPEGR